ncbi:MAG: HAD family hydrolase [Christensenellales bacterium]|jgi:phosphoglycolate phosphatase
MTDCFDKKLVIFDLDGCLVDTGGEIALMINTVRDRLGLPSLDRDFVVSAVGKGLRRLFDTCMADAPELIEKALALSPDIYAEISGTLAKPFPGVMETLKALKGKRKIALATNKIRRATENLLAALGMADYFDAICCADDCGHPKPNPACILWILNKLGVDAKDAVMVGDTPTDVLTARNAGVVAIAVTYGMAQPDAVRAAEPFLLANSMDEVRSFLLPR